MKAVILAGGRGTRLHPVTGGVIPKPMTPLAGKPVLEHLLRRLADSGVTELCCTLQCLPKPIQDYFGDGSSFGVHLTYRIEDRPLGTAGAVKNCRDFTGDEDFLVLSGDGVFDFDLRKLMEEHRRQEAVVTMALYPHPAPLSFGLALTDRQGRVRRFVEKPDWPRVVTDLVNTGIYALSPRAMDYVPTGVPFDFAADLFPLLLQRDEPLCGLPMEGYWRDIGEPRAYYQANLDALEGRIALLPPPPRRPTAVRPSARRYVCAVPVATAHRARLMRSLSSLLMEAGADFTDGITLSTLPGSLHITPDPQAERLLVESDEADTARRYADLAERIDRENA